MPTGMGIRARFRSGRNPLRRVHLFDKRLGPRAHLYILPNLFTSASLFLALYSLVHTSAGDFRTAAWLIIMSAVCDLLDGPIARLTRTASEFGVQYDSLADVVAFGVAPAFLMHQHLLKLDGTMLPDYAPRLALGACALYAICAAIRLARFNVQSTTTEKHHFTGLPTPGAAGAVVTFFLFIEWVAELPFLQGVLDKSWTQAFHRGTLLLMVLLAMLMVSEVHFPKLKNLVKPSEKPINTLVLLVAIVCLFITFDRYMPVFLFGAFVAYLSVTMANEVRRRMREGETE